MSAADVANIRLQIVPRLLVFLAFRPALCILRYRGTRRNSCAKNNSVRIPLVAGPRTQTITESRGGR